MSSMQKILLMFSPICVCLLHCARITVLSLVAAYFGCGTVLNVGMSLVNKMRYLVANRVTAAMSASLVFIVCCLLLF